jgi:large subunit ribosomal protein L25
MSTELVTIAAEARTETGKGYARKLRAESKIPAVIYDKAKSTSIELNPHLLSKAVKSGGKFNLEFNGSTKVVKVQELQLDPVKRIPLHIDLVYA